MPLFVCDKCECVDNTACGGTYWSKDMDFWAEEYQGLALCIVCAPPEFKGGQKNEKAGTWHGHFPRRRFNDQVHRVLNSHIWTESGGDPVFNSINYDNTQYSNRNLPTQKATWRISDETIADVKRLEWPEFYGLKN